uniref:Uncharacterized protein n=1 Tax=Anopheles darlingi TaxID=43151 RepID=A0A2M4CKU5_ANODA
MYVFVCVCVCISGALFLCFNIEVLSPLVAFHTFVKLDSISITIILLLGVFLIEGLRFARLAQVMYQVPFVLVYTKHCLPNCLLTRTKWKPIV